jgi:hypothetical protein
VSDRLSGLRLRPMVVSAVGATVIAVIMAGATAARIDAAPGALSRLTVYSVAKQEQFINNADARTRGVGKNPFGNFKDLAPVTGKNTNGPFAGDDAMFSFNLYSSASLSKKIGTAILMCYYNLNKNAFCDASYHLASGGTLIASGAFSFTASQFTLAVTGGYGPYSGLAGTVAETPSANHAQRLVFSLAKPSGQTRTSSYDSKPIASAFVNNSDDRDRGRGKNPFGNYAGAAAPVPTSEQLFGPFAGDEGIYASTLSTPSKPSAGSSTFICQYNFNENAICDAAFQLDGGLLVAKGSYNFEDRHFTLAVIGGTAAYRGARGQIAVTAKGPTTQAQPVRRQVPMLQAKHFDITTVRVPTTKPLTVFIDPVHETFVTNDDDRKRGDVSNPFATVKKTGTVDRGVGPFPGDSAVFSFGVYNTSSLRTTSGSSVYTCQYHFNKNAFCDASFRLNGGTLYASGAFSFNATTYDLAVTGGTGSYEGATGDVHATASGKHAQRLAFRLG